MVYSGDEVKSARTVVRVPESEKWSKDLFAAVKLTPWAMHQPRELEVVFNDKTDIEDAVSVDKPPISRQVYIKASDFEEHGLTRGCPKCDYFQRHEAWST